MMKNTLGILLLALTLGCHGYIIHPGSANVADSQAYDALIAAQSVIDTARSQFAATPPILPATMKPFFNTLVDAYNVAHPAWLTYHDTALKGIAVDPTILNQDLTALAKALASFKKGS
jgi:hypothetical protein